MFTLLSRCAVCLLLLCSWLHAEEEAAVYFLPNFVVTGGEGPAQIQLFEEGNETPLLDREFERLTVQPELRKAGRYKVRIGVPARNLWREWSELEAIRVKAEAATLHASLKDRSQRPLSELFEGLMAGEVSHNRAILQGRIFPAPGETTPARLPESCWLELAYYPDFKKVYASKPQALSADTDYILRSSYYQLDPATDYFYRIAFRMPGDETVHYSATAQFRTAAGAEGGGSLSIGFGQGQHYGRYWASEDKTLPNAELGLPAWRTLAGLNLDYYVGLGDSVHYGQNPAVVSRDAMRGKWHELFRMQRLQQLLSGTASFWLKNDNDYRGEDADPKQDEEATIPHTRGVATFREQLPVVSEDSPRDPSYRTYTLNKAVQIWLLEGRDYRDPNFDYDDGEKSLWGRTQKEWLQRTLKASETPFKLLVSPTPIIGPDDYQRFDNHTQSRGGKGFRKEGDAFLKWLSDEDFDPKGLFIICGDQSWQYHSVHPTGFQEFSTGVLHDGLARLGFAPGDGAGTDPGSLIEQLYSSEEAMGGFLQMNIGIDGPHATLSALWKDASGTERYRYELKKAMVRRAVTKKTIVLE